MIFQVYPPQIQGADIHVRNRSGQKPLHIAKSSRLGFGGFRMRLTATGHPGFNVLFKWISKGARWLLGFMIGSL